MAVEINEVDLAAQIKGVPSTFDDTGKEGGAQLMRLFFLWTNSTLRQVHGGHFDSFIWSLGLGIW